MPSRASCVRALKLGTIIAAGALLGLPGAFGDIVITEIHYAPVDDLGQAASDLEFVEIFNDGPEPYDLYRYRFTRGISYEFERVFLNGLSYLVVCRNSDAVKAEYGISSVVGNFSGALDNAGETIELSNPQGAVVSSVPYNDRGRWPAGAKGTGHSLAILDPYSDASDADSWALSAQRGGTPGAWNFGGQASYQDTVLIDRGETWKYFKGTQEPSSPTTLWRQRSFSDASWLSGATGIGYGDGDDATVLNDMQNQYLSVFCRKSFAVADVSAIDSLVFSMTYDDGFYAYLNGTQVASRNMSSQAYSAEATSAGEPTTEDIDISSFKNLLVAGTNVLAVQVHNAGLSSSDLSCIPRLVSRKEILPEEVETVPVVVNEGFFLNGGGGARFIELHNASSGAVNLAGYHLTDDFTNLTKYQIQAPATLPARGFLHFTEAQLGFDFSVVPITKERVSVALTNPAGTRVVDAAIFEPKVDGKSEALIPDGGKKFSPAADPTPGAGNQVTVEQNVIINEIMYHPITDDDLDEFIEFYNKGNQAVDLSGWKVEGVGFTFPPGTSIPPLDYLVIAADPPRIVSRYNLPEARVVSTPWSGALKDAGERLSLIDLNGNVADNVRYHDGGQWPAWPDGGGSSLELIDPESDGEEPGSWDSSDDSGEAIAHTIGYGGVSYGGGESDFGMMLAQEGIVIVDDVSLIQAPAGSNLISNGTFDASTSPWRIEGTHIRSGRTTDPAEVLSGPGSLKLICWNGSGDYKVNRVETDTGTQRAGSQYTISFTARWVVGSPRIITIGDYSVSQPANPGIAGSGLVQVPATLGTPGEINSVSERQIGLTGSANIGPSIDRVRHDPPVPEGGEPVVVSARVRDPDGVTSVRLFYRTETPSGTFTQVSMTDADGDGVYTGGIPQQQAGIRVLFYVLAEDTAGASARFPADISKRTHPPILRAAQPAANDLLYCMYRHDRRLVSTTHHSYRFVLDEESENYLQTRRGLSNETVEGTFIFGSDKVYYNAEIRFAGSPWLRQNGSWGNSYSLKLPKDNPLHGRKRSFSLDQHGSDGRERVSHYLLRMSAGSTLLPYFDFHALVRFQLNDVRDATYEAIDKPNRQYIEFWFPGGEEGFNFEMDDRFSFNDSGSKTGNAEGHVLYPPYGATSGGPNKENYRWYFNPRSRANEDDYSTFQTFCRVMDSRMTPNTTFDTQIHTVADVEEILRVFAIELNIDDWDTWGGNRGKNCYFYQSSADGLWRLIPWDLELTYGNINAVPMPSSPTSTFGNYFSEIQRMLNRPQIKRLFYGILAEQVNAATGFFQSSFLSPYMQAIASAGVGGTGIGQSGGYIDQRANLIRGWIRSAVYPQVRLAITTNGGAAFESPENFLDLAGTAPADVFHFAVARNGVFLDDPAPEVQLSDTDLTRWTIEDIPLSRGVNTIAIVGLSSTGSIVDQDSIQVTLLGGWDAPSIESVAPDAGSAGDLILLRGADFHQGIKVYVGSSTPAVDVVFNETEDPTLVKAKLPSGVSPGTSSISVENLDGQGSNTLPFTILEPLPAFVRGDANKNGTLELSDALRVLFHLFHGAPTPCRDALDADDSGEIDLTDAMVVLGYLFQEGPAPAAPYPQKGSDPTRGDDLDCADGLP